jgi:hypothetical protein
MREQRVNIVRWSQAIPSAPVCSEMVKFTNISAWVPFNEASSCEASNRSCSNIKGVIERPNQWVIDVFEAPKTASICVESNGVKWVCCLLL